MRIRALFVLLTAFSLMMTVHAQDETPPFDLVTGVRDIIDVEAYLENAALNVEPFDVFTDWNNSDFRTIENAAVSPNGAMLAWTGELNQRVTRELTDVICHHIFETNQSNCFLLPDERLTSVSPLNWSPDNRFITFTEDRILLNDESDVWVYSVSPQTLINMTDDMVTGPDYDTLVAKVDLAPTWSPFDSSLYLFRNTAPGGLSPIFDVYRFTAEQIDTTVAAEAELLAELFPVSDPSELAERTPEAFDPATLPEPTDVPTTPVPEPELIVSLSGFPLNSSIAETYQETLRGATQIDNGSLFMAMAVNSESEPATSGIWLIDLNGRQLIPLVTMQPFIDSAPEWVIDYQITGITWANDSTGLAVAIAYQGPSAEFTNIYFYDIATGIVTPYVDYGPLENESLFFGGEAPFIKPDSAVLLPGNALFYYNRSSRDTLNAVNVTDTANPQRVNIGRQLTQQNRAPSSVGFSPDFIRVLLDKNLILIGR